MAIQNFLSGGFYGSIGELTGRRWKNKRVVQAKFKPKNPKTPAQERQRMLFTRGSALAKIAQQVNWKAPQFDNPIKTDWNMRQTVAINALKDGQSEWEALPLAPNGFIPNHKIGTCTLSEISADGSMKVLLEGTDLLPGKKYACALFVQSGNKKGQIIVGSTPQPSVDALTAIFRLPDTSDIKGEEVYIKISSIDDTSTDTVTLSAGILLQQGALEPYVFNPSLAGVTYDNAGTLKISVKLGEEQIESYDPFVGTTIRLFDKVWTKATAVNANKLDTDNDTDINTSFTISKTTVAKSTATVSFYCSFEDAILYEKYNAKLDISINAKNIKGADSAENTQTLTLSSQAFPEYLQDEFTFAGTPTIKVPSTTNQKLYGDWVMIGDAFVADDLTANGKMLTFNEDFEGDPIEDGELTEITLQDGTKYSGSAIEEYLENMSPIITYEGAKVGWYIQDGTQIKSFKGKVRGSLYCNGYTPKIAIAGYRVYTIPEQYDSTLQVEVLP